jgi:glycosyltransferase involved in cell wall biosynthesis
MSAVAAARQRSAETVPRVVIVHDYLTQKGGAERVVLAMHRAFPEAPIYTSLFRPETTFPEFRTAEVRTLAINRIPQLRQHHRLALPILAPSFSSTKIDADVVLCSSSGWAHGTRTTGRKVVYCHTPARWLYQGDRYIGNGHRGLRAAIALLRPLLIAWDRKAARSADRYLTQSTIVCSRIRELYGINAQLVPAPHPARTYGGLRAIADIEAGYFLCVSRLLPYKNLDAVIEAFSGIPDRRLLLVGDGPERSRLSKILPANVTLLGSVSDDQLAWLYTNCLGLIAAAYEDYGLVPLEAASFGKPTAALHWGGFLDTVIDGRTGVFFEAPTPAAIAEALSRLKTTPFDADTIRQHAAQYSEDRFINRLRDIVAAEVVAGR